MDAPLSPLRQVAIVIAVVLGMYALAAWTGDLLNRLFAFSDYDATLWVERLAFFLWGVVAGAVLMTSLTWRLRWLAVLALPVLVLLIVPNLAYLRVRSFLQEDISYLVMWPYYVYLGVPVLGMIVGGLIAARRRTLRSQ
jgi:hypothetical protein